MAADPGAVKSKYRGVSWHRGKRKWQAQIKAGDGKNTHLGRFDNEDDAARAFNDAANFLHMDWCVVGANLITLHQPQGAQHDQRGARSERSQ